jgi:hypothetical protein
MTTIQENIDLPGLAAPDDAVIIKLELVDSDSRPIEVFHTASGVSIISPYEFRLAVNSQWSLDLEANSEISPAGTKYRRTIKYRDNAYFDFLDVPAAGGPYRVDEVLSTAPAAIGDAALQTHADDATQHGGGKRLGITHFANAVTASTVYVDTPGGSITLIDQPAAFALILDLPITVEEISRFGNFQILAGAAVIWSRQTLLAQSAAQALVFNGMCALPNTLYTPVAGATVTYKVQWKTSIATSDLAIVTEFGVPVNSGVFEAVGR